MNIDFIGLFLLLAGFIVGLGAVTVIDIHGFFGRTSSYWTEATIRTHKITKPMIWAGMALALVGGGCFFRNDPFSGVPMHLSIIASILVLNGLFLSLYVSPYLVRAEKDGRAAELLPLSLQKKITVSLIVSDLGWWGGLMLVVQYLLQR